MTLWVLPEDGAVPDVQTMNEILLSIGIVMDHTTHHCHLPCQRFNAGLKTLTSKWIENALREGKGRDDHHIIRIEIVGGRKAVKRLISVRYSSFPHLIPARRPHIHVKHHKVAGHCIANGDIPQSVNWINDLLDALQLSIFKMEDTIGMLTDSHNIQCDSQSLWIVVFKDVLFHRFQFVDVKVHGYTNGTTCHTHDGIKPSPSP